MPANNVIMYIGRYIVGILFKKHITETVQLVQIL